jgi:hypothetical protein
MAYALRLARLFVVLPSAFLLHSAVFAEPQKVDQDRTSTLSDDCGPYPKSTDEFSQDMISATTAIRRNDFASALPSIEAAQKLAKYPNENAAIDSLHAIYANKIGDVRGELNAWISFKAFVDKCASSDFQVKSLAAKIDALQQKLAASDPNGNSNH